MLEKGNRGNLQEPAFVSPLCPKTEPGPSSQALTSSTHQSSEFKSQSKISDLALYGSVHLHWGSALSLLVVYMAVSLFSGL